MIVVRFKAICSNHLGQPGKPWVVVRVESSNGVPQDISPVAGPFDDVSTAYAAMDTLARMEP